MEKFKRQNPKGVHEIQHFLADNFYPEGTELASIDPSDWTPNPAIVSQISDSQLQQWIIQLNAKWKLLTKTYDKNLICPECVSSSIQLPHPFVIPGGRFREFYYWDTFWIVEGLLACGMHQTVKGIIGNFIQLIKLFGFIPNCSRIYCTNRTQPPMFPRIVQAYFKETNDLDYLKEIIPYLDKEYEFWMTHRSIVMNLASENTTDGSIPYLLNIYKASSYKPRPESYWEDFTNAHKHSSTNRQRYYYDNVASIAESGWDFSSRWYFDKSIISSDILRIIPVDLNSYMLKNEEILSELHRKIGSSKSKEYLDSWNARKEAINKVFWNQAASTWYDFDLELMKKRESFFISNLLPLLDNNLQNEHATEIIGKHHNLLFDHLAGIPVSTPTNSLSEQQWDYPNAWAPYEYFLVTWLDANNRTSEAIQVSQRWLNSTFCGFTKTAGYLFEKYNAEQLGQPGVGGEYTVQEGFGWTNGVIFVMVRMFLKDLAIPSTLANTCAPHAENIVMLSEATERNYKFVMIGAAILFPLMIFCTWWWWWTKRKRARKSYANLNNLVFSNAY